MSLDTSRTEYILGKDGCRRLAESRVLVFGVGGVGGHLCEALARAGVGTITVVDGDDVAPSNLNRQIIALSSTVGRPKVEVIKERIVPRTSGALGYTMQVEEGNHYLMTKEEIETKIATYTGGRAAEEVAFGSVTTGASNDIEQATKLARAMITRFGMSEEFDMVAMETVTNQYLGGDTSLTCSAETQRQIDLKTVEVVKKQHELAKRVLSEHKEKLDELSKYLYEKETITGEEFMAILNR